MGTRGGVIQESDGSIKTPAALYQEEDGRKKEISYASRGSTKAERNCPAHKLEFLALKWAVCEKFKDYLTGARPRY
jgi:hypothetical protein